MLAIAAAGAFVGLFVLWVIVPRKLLKDRQPRAAKQPRPPRNSRFLTNQEENPPTDAS